MRAKRTDKNQADIVRDLRLAGVQVLVTNFGDDFPDLLCGWRGKWTLLEIKKPDGDITRGQLEFARDAKGNIGIATTTDEACNVLFGNTLTSSQQTKIATWLIKNPDQQSLSVKKLRKLVNA